MKKGYLLNKLCPVWTDGIEVMPRSYGWITIHFVVVWCQWVRGSFLLEFDR